MPPFNVTIPSHDGKSFGGYVAKANTSGASNPNAPALLVIQEIFGVNAGMRQMCDEWAAKGFHAICPDIFWRMKPGIELTDKTPIEWDQAIGFMNNYDTDNGIKDLQSTLNVARVLADSNGPICNGKVGSIGFCLGGKLAYMLASRSDADCNISYYGVGLAELLGDVPNIKTPLLMHFAERDKYMNGDALKTVQATLAKNSLIESHVYKGAEHAFARINGEHFDAGAAKAAHERSLAFLAKWLK